MENQQTTNGHRNGSNGSNGQSYDQHTFLDKDMSPEDALKRMRTAGSISLSPELFEKLYLSPQNKVKGDLRKTFANPTPMSVSYPSL
jgi:hypothetical protein